MANELARKQVFTLFVGFRGEGGLYLRVMKYIEHTGKGIKKILLDIRVIYGICTRALPR